MEWSSVDHKTQRKPKNKTKKKKDSVTRNPNDHEKLTNKKKWKKEKKIFFFFLTGKAPTKNVFIFPSQIIYGGHRYWK